MCGEKNTALGFRFFLHKTEMAPAHLSEVAQSGNLMSKRDRWGQTNLREVRKGSSLGPNATVNRVKTPRISEIKTELAHSTSPRPCNQARNPSS